MYKNLLAEMARAGLKKQDLAEALGVWKNTISDKFSGKSDWLLSEMIKVQDKLETENSLDYLFKD
jgi:transcriptional regulator with XRE-family HTH domain